MMTGLARADPAAPLSQGEAQPEADRKGPVAYVWGKDLTIRRAYEYSLRSGGDVRGAVLDA